MLQWTKISIFTHTQKATSSSKSHKQSTEKQKGSPSACKLWVHYNYTSLL